MSTPVPFEIGPTVAELTGGVIAISGIVRYDETAVILEHRTTDSGMAVSAVTTSIIPLSEIIGVEYRDRLITARLVLTGSRLEVFRGIPGEHDHRLALKIKRRDRATARRAAWDLQVAIEERKLRHLRDGTT